MAAPFNTSRRLCGVDIWLILPAPPLRVVVRGTPSGGGRIAPSGDQCQLRCGARSGPVGQPTHGGSVMAKGTLIAAMKIGRAAEDEFHDWYDTEHLPERQRVPGFLLCQRWLGAEDHTVSVATYDLESLAVLAGSAYRAIGGDNLSPWSKRITARVERLARFEGDQILPGDQLPPTNAGGLLRNAMNIAPALEAEFNEWYD